MGNKGWFKLASIYIGTVIGAGFASGQEIIQFFGIYGYKGIFGVAIATMLFSIFGSFVLLRIYNRKIMSYDDFMVPMLGKNIGRLISGWVTVFLFLGYCVMLAGGGAVFYQQFHLPYHVGIYIMSLATFLTFIFSVKGLSVVNTVLVPLLMIGIVMTGVFVMAKEGFTFSNYHGADITKTGTWFTSAILYVSYNSLAATVVMTSLYPIISSKGAAIKGGIMGGMGLGLLAFFIIFPTMILYTDLYQLEVPMLKLAESLGYYGRFIYSLVLLCAMFTTALANGFGFIKKMGHYFSIREIIITSIFCLVTIPLAQIGFANLVAFLYPIFGYIGLFILIMVLFHGMTRRWARFRMGQDRRAGR